MDYGQTFAVLFGHTLPLINSWFHHVPPSMNSRKKRSNQPCFFQLFFSCCNCKYFPSTTGENRFESRILKPIGAPNKLGWRPQVRRHWRSHRASPRTGTTTTDSVETWKHVVFYLDNDIILDIDILWTIWTIIVWKTMTDINNYIYH